MSFSRASSNIDKDKDHFDNKISSVYPHQEDDKKNTSYQSFAGTATSGSQVDAVNNTNNNNINSELNPQTVTKNYKREKSVKKKLETSPNNLKKPNNLMKSVSKKKIIEPELYKVTPEEIRLVKSTKKGETKAKDKENKSPKEISNKKKSKISIPLSQSINIVNEAKSLLQLQSNSQQSQNQQIEISSSNNNNNNNSNNNNSNSQIKLDLPTITPLHNNINKFNQSYSQYSNQFSPKQSEDHHQYFKHINTINTINNDAYSDLDRREGGVGRGINNSIRNKSIVNRSAEFFEPTNNEFFNHSKSFAYPVGHSGGMYGMSSGVGVGGFEMYPGMNYQIQNKQISQIQVPQINQGIQLNKGSQLNQGNQNQKMIITHPNQINIVPIKEIKDNKDDKINIRDQSFNLENTINSNNLQTEQLVLPNITDPIFETKEPEITNPKNKPAVKKIISEVKQVKKVMKINNRGTNPLSRVSKSKEKSKPKTKTDEVSNYYDNKYLKDHSSGQVKNSKTFRKDSKSDIKIKQKSPPLTAKVEAPKAVRDDKSSYFSSNINQIFDNNNFKDYQSYLSSQGVNEISNLNENWNNPSNIKNQFPQQIYSNFPTQFNQQQSQGYHNPYLNQQQQHSQNQHIYQHPERLQVSQNQPIQTVKNTKKLFLKEKIKCCYCLKAPKAPIQLKCAHYLCFECAVEIKSISEFLINKSTNWLECPDCTVKTFYDDNSVGINANNLDHVRGCLNQLIIDYTPAEEEFKDKPVLCEICPESIYKHHADWECLNCDVMICQDCKERHLLRHFDHKIIQLSSFYQTKVESLLCEIHKEPLKLYCLTEKKPCCLICANYDNFHGNHEVKSLKMIIENCNIDFGLLIRDGTFVGKFFETFTSELTKIKNQMTDEYSFFKQKAFETKSRLIKLIENRFEQINKDLNDVFQVQIDELERKITNYTLLFQRFNYFKNMIVEVDLDNLRKIERVNLINNLMKSVSFEDLIDLPLDIDFKRDTVSPILDSTTPYNYYKNPQEVYKLSRENIAIITEKLSLKNSCFCNDPHDKITKLMQTYSFLQIHNHDLHVLLDLFKGSSTINVELINSDLLAVFPRIRSGELIYKVSLHGSTPETFHHYCDNKGPTLTIVKTVDNYVFGGFNPVSWMSENMYNETEEAFLFSLSDGKYRKPLRCPLKHSKKKYSIKQSDAEFSPGFGETNEADLFIAYKNIQNSYSNLGNVYECPEGYDPGLFFAGKSKGWEIVDIEVYSIELMDSNMII